MALVEGFRGDVLVWLRLDGDGMHRALPPARSVVVPVAAAGSRDRRQHRRGFSALQQIVQLLLFRARSLGCATQAAVPKLVHAADRTAPPADDAATGRTRATALNAPRAPARPQPVDPRGRCRFVQRLRTGNPCAQQCLLRSRTLRLAFRRLAAPRRCAAGDGAGDQKHARGPAAHLQCDARSEMGRRGRRLRHRRRMFAGSYAVVGGVADVDPVDLHIRGLPAFAIANSKRTNRASCRLNGKK